MNREDKDDLRDQMLAELYKTLKAEEAAEEADASDPNQPILPKKDPSAPGAVLECPSCGYSGTMDTFGYGY